MLEAVGYMKISVYEDCAYFAAVLAFQRLFQGTPQHDQQQASQNSASPSAQQGSSGNLQPDSGSVFPPRATADNSGQIPVVLCCKDCTHVHLVPIKGCDDISEREIADALGREGTDDSCTYQPAPPATARTLRAILHHKEAQVGSATVKILLRVQRCQQFLCITLSEASGSFFPSPSHQQLHSAATDKYLVHSIHITIEAASHGEPIPLTVYLQQKREPQRLQSRVIKSMQPSGRIAHDYTHRPIVLTLV